MATRLSDLVRVVLAPNPSPVTLEGTNTYVVGDRMPVVIDPGPAIDGHLEAVLDEAGRPSLVVLTHTHPDHAEGAETFAAMARAPLAAFAGGTGTCATAAAIADGQRIDVDGTALVAMHTPGHSSDHLSFVLESERAMFTGDHVLGRGTTVIAYPDGHLADYMTSLARAKAARATRLYPGHGPVVDEPDAVLDYYVAHRLERERQVIAALEAGDTMVPQMVERIYWDVDPSLHAVAALSVRAHLEKLAAEGRAREEGGSWTPV
jgi:glyoxylase-like metal-dependent hydrolase (beta-lactamase superfamily II)